MRGPLHPLFCGREHGCRFGYMVQRFAGRVFLRVQGWTDLPLDLIAIAGAKRFTLELRGDLSERQNRRLASEDTRRCSRCR